MGRGLKGVEDGSRPRRARLGSSQGEPPRKADVALPRPPQVLAEARLPPPPAPGLQVGTVPPAAAAVGAERGFAQSPRCVATLRFGAGSEGLLGDGRVRTRGERGAFRRRNRREGSPLRARRGLFTAPR